jgi:sporulation protein YlmC with PRC-barrel domain
MDIPINAEVHCADGNCGKSTYVIINPVKEKVTHLVVNSNSLLPEEHLVPIDYVIESTPETISLRCTKQDIEQMPAFVVTEFIPSGLASIGADPYLMWPYAVPESTVIPLEHKQVPPGELALHRGAQIIARDGHIGKIDEFLVDPVSDEITHLIVREGGIWMPRDVTIPVSAIQHIEERKVYLGLDKEEIRRLPAIPISQRKEFEDMFR